MPDATGRAKTHPQFPVSAMKRHVSTIALVSYPPQRYFGPPIVLLLLRKNKPRRMDFLSRGPRKTVLCLEIMRSKSAGNHGTLQAKSTNFQGLVSIPKTEKLLLWHLK